MHILGRAVLLCLLVLTGCTSAEHYSASQAHNFSKADFSVGDVVILSTKDGLILDFRVAEVSETSIHGKRLEGHEGVEVVYVDIRDASIGVTPHDHDKADGVLMDLPEPVLALGAEILAVFLGFGIAALLMAL